MTGMYILMASLAAAGTLALCLSKSEPRHRDVDRLLMRIAIVLLGGAGGGSAVLLLTWAFP